MASAFNIGLKHNVKSDKAHLKLTVRYSHFYTKAKLLDVVSHVAESTGITR
jgi:metal-dependent amidase/aminoacylase/carboxypeptidase family protein